MRNFKNKVVVITGAGSGIGRALALNFAKKGAHLALNDFKQEGLEETAALLDNKVKVLRSVFDVSDEAAMHQFADEVVARFGRVDVMINNAGVAQDSRLSHEISTDDFEWLLGINMWGTIYGSKAFLPHLRQQKESSLVNISSVFGLAGIPGVSSYSVSKFAVRGLSESMLLEERLNKTGVAVSCVHPGGIKTNIAKSARGADLTRLEKFEKSLKMPPQNAAKIIIKGIQKKKAKILVGADAHLIYYMDKFAKGLLNKAIIHNYNKMK